MGDLVASKVKLVSLMIEFIYNTIMGHNSSFYRSFDKKFIKSPKLNFVILDITIDYMNRAYISLIKEDDPYFLKYFKQMSKLMNHSQICLLNITIKFLLEVHNSIDRNKLDMSSYEKYMKDVSEVLKTKIDIIKIKIFIAVGHKCEGEDIKDCDPKKLPFSFEEHTITL